MKTPIGKLFLSSINNWKYHLLDNSYLFNFIRYLLAGDQRGTKKFVYENLKKYSCKSVLDIGCGTGDFAESCPEGVAYLGTDLNLNFIKYAQNRYRKGRNKKFIYEDIFKDDNHQSFDAVLFISMLHHFSDHDLAIILKKIKKIARKVVIVADIIPDPPHLMQQIIARMDRGRFVRPRQGKLEILRKFFHIRETKTINSRFAVQFGIVCEV